MILLSHPHNPCGKIFKKEEVDLIVRESEKIQCIILSDEIMSDFTINNETHT